MVSLVTSTLRDPSAPSLRPTEDLSAASTTPWLPLRSPSLTAPFSTRNRTAIARMPQLKVQDNAFAAETKTMSKETLILPTNNASALLETTLANAA